MARPPRWRDFSRPFASALWVTFVVVVVLPLLFAAASVVGALRTPGNESFKAKWADWLRSHHAVLVVDHLEAFYYGHNAPKKGGRPKALNAVPELPTTKPPPVAVAHAQIAHLTPPDAVPLLVRPGLPGEGSWQPTFARVHGIPAMYVAQFRADDVYTSEITSAVWIDTKLLRVRLVPGAREPGGSWPQTPFVGDGALGSLVAAFNGGFRLKDAHGGFYLDGREAVPLRAGTASVIVYKDGRVNVGIWGRDATLTPDVEGVLQNLTLLVDGGQIDPLISHNDTRTWGHTLSGKTAVARSGVGVDRNGGLIYVAGPSLTAKTLAESLQRAGAMRALTLDINPEWVTFNFYNHPDPADPAKLEPSKLYPQMQRPAARYLGPTRESRDFFTISRTAP